MINNNHRLYESLITRGFPFLHLVFECTYILVKAFININFKIFTYVLHFFTKDETRYGKQHFKNVCTLKYVIIAWVFQNIFSKTTTQQSYTNAEHVSFPFRFNLFLLLDKGEP